MHSPSSHAVSPLGIVVHQSSRRLEVTFDNGQSFEIPFEVLRVFSPSAEVQGHGPGQAILQTGKRHVSIIDIEAVGHYGIKPRFSDGHDSGIFTWAYLLHLGQHQESLWRDHLSRLAAAGIDRDTPMSKSAQQNCDHHH